MGDDRIRRQMKGKTNYQVVSEYKNAVPVSSIDEKNALQKYDEYYQLFDKYCEQYGNSPKALAEKLEKLAENIKKLEQNEPLRSIINDARAWDRKQSEERGRILYEEAAQKIIRPPHMKISGLVQNNTTKETPQSKPPQNNVVKSKCWRWIIAIATVIVAVFVVKGIHDAKYDKFCETKILEAAKAGTLELKVDIESELTEYHHLGKNISNTYTCNGKAIRDGDIITVKSSLSFGATITERDGIPDVGSGQVTMYFPPYEKQTTLTVKVQEKGGHRYPDAYAVYEITFKVSPIVPGVGFWEVIFS